MLCETLLGPIDMSHWPRAIRDPRVGFAALLFSGLLAVNAVTPVSAWERGPGPGAAFATGLAAGIIGMGIATAGPPPPPWYYGYYGPACRPGPVTCREFVPPCFQNRFGDMICPAPEQRCYSQPVCY